MSVARRSLEASSTSFRGGGLKTGWTDVGTLCPRFFLFLELIGVIGAVLHGNSKGFFSWGVLKLVVNPWKSLSNEGGGFQEFGGCYAMLPGVGVFCSKKRKKREARGRRGE